MGVDKSPTDTYPMDLLSVGDSIFPVTMVHAVTILACWLMRPSDVDSYAVWVVICFVPENHLHKFVVWNAIDRPDGWSMESGDYCRDMEEALTAYAKRGGKHRLPED